MHVGLNLVFLVPGETGGMEVYARELVAALAEAGPEHRFTAFVGRDAAREDLGVETVVLPLRASDRRDWVRAEQLVLPRTARVEVLHSLGGTAPGWGRFARVVTIHDLHYRTRPEAHFGVRALGMRVLVPLAARTSHRVITVSEHSGRELVELLGVDPERLDVIPNGLGRPAAAPTSEAELRARLALGARPVLVSLSAKRPHKNLARLLEALAAIAPADRPLLVLPGYPTPHEDELRARSRALGVEGDVRFLGWTPDADVEGLLALAAGFVMPSLAEGFGLPVLEAMARGVPVACSGTGALGEVAGAAALTFDPESVPEMTAAIERLLREPPDVEAARARAATFTWRRAAEATLRSYALASRQRASSARRLRS